MWSVPRMWEGETCVILASGPSMNQAVANTVRGTRTIAINTTFQLAPWADMLYAADARWWKAYEKPIDGPSWRILGGIKVACEPTQYKEVHQIKNTGESGFDPDPGCVRIGGNSGYQAIHIAAHAGAKRILLCGFDMKGCHWHGRHPEPLRNHGEGIYARWLKNFDGLAKALNGLGIEVLNCTPGSALKAFPMVALEEALCLVR